MSYHLGRPAQSPRFHGKGGLWSRWLPHVPVSSFLTGSDQQLRLGETRGQIRKKEPEEKTKMATNIHNPFSFSPASMSLVILWYFLCSDYQWATVLSDHVGPRTPSAQEGLKRMWDCKQRCGRKDTESAGRYRNKKGGGGGGWLGSHKSEKSGCKLYRQKEECGRVKIKEGWRKMTPGKQESKLERKHSRLLSHRSLSPRQCIPCNKMINIRNSGHYGMTQESRQSSHKIGVK